MCRAGWYCNRMPKKESLSVVRYALPAAVGSFLANRVGIEYLRSRGWTGDEGALDVVAHANNFFDSIMVTSAASLAIESTKSPRNLPLRKALAVGGLVLGVGLGCNAISETQLAHEQPFSMVFNKHTKTDTYDFLYGTVGSMAMAAAYTNAIRQHESEQEPLQYQTSD